MNNVKKKNIAFVTLHLTDGGAERVTSEIAMEWEKKGYDVTFIQLAPTMYTNQYKISKGMKFINLEYNKNKSIRYIRWIYSLIRIMKSMPETIFIGFVAQSHFVLGIASLFTDNRIVLSLRNDPKNASNTFLLRHLRNFSFGRADLCVFQTKDAMNFFSKAICNKGVIIPNPINGSLPNVYKGKRDKKIISACRLDKQKNIPMMIFAFKKLQEFYPEYKLYIYGRGPLESEIRQLIRQENLEDKVLLPGFSDNIYEEMNRSTMFVLSSDYEGISNSMLEALAMGLPSVVTDCPAGGARMVIENNVNGILVPVGDVKAMFEGMKRILDDKVFARMLSNNAVEIRNKYPVKKVAEMWLDAFDNFIHGITY